MADATDWRNPTWSKPLPVVPSGPGGRISAKFTPALLGFANALLCVWVDADDNLNYTQSRFDPVRTATATAAAAAAAAAAHHASFFSQRVWTAPMPIVCFENWERTPEKTGYVPYLAVSQGQVHLVFVNDHGCLVHLRYVPQAWESDESKEVVSRC